MTPDNLLATPNKSPHFYMRASSYETVIFIWIRPKKGRETAREIALLKSTYPMRFRVQFRTRKIKVYMEAMYVRAIAYE